MLPWLPWRAVITGRNQETDALCLTKNIISWVLLASLSHHVSLAVVRDPGLPRPGSGSCMSGWVKPWAAPVQPCLPGWLSIVLCTGQPGCWEDFLIALGMGALPRAPRGPNFRDAACKLIKCAPFSTVDKHHSCTSRIAHTTRYACRANFWEAAAMLVYSDTAGNFLEADTSSAFSVLW